MTADTAVGLGCLAGVVAAAPLLNRALKRTPRPAARRPDPAGGYLDRELFRFGGAAWASRDLCEGVLVLGRTGSGKTSGPLLALTERLLAVGGGLLTCIKPSDRDRYLALAAGKPGVVMHAGPDSARLDFLATLLHGVEADDATKALVLAQGFSQLMEVAGRGRGGGGSDENRFWQTAADRLTRQAFHLMLAAGERPSVPLLLAVCQTLPQSAEELSSEAWKSRPLNQLLRRGFANKAGREAEVQGLMAYFTGEMAALSGRTKSVIQATVAGVADSVATGVLGRLLCSESSFSLPDLIEEQGVLIVDPGVELGEVGRLLTVAVKHACQQVLLRRRVAADSPAWGLVVDEYQTVATRSDWLYAGRCRESRGPLVLATQGVETIRAEMGGDSAKDEVDALVSNLATKIVTLPTWPTAVWACEQLGRTRVRMHGGSASAAPYASAVDLFLPQGPGQASGSYSEVFEQVLRPEELSGMRCGGHTNGFLVDALVLQSGKRHPDTGGMPFCFATFDQRRG